MPLALVLVLPMLAAGARPAPAHAAGLEDSRDVSGTREGGRVDPRHALDIHPREAGSLGLLDDSARPYAEARKMLARGLPSVALKALSNRRGDVLLADREALVRGDALLALGDVKRAREAYLEAIARSELKAVSIAAARGLIGALATLKLRDEELLYVDALLDEPNLPRRQNVLYQKALVLRDMGRTQESADVAWRIVQEHPASRAAQQAATLLKEYGRRGVRIPVPSAKLEIARVRNLVSSGEYRHAEQEIQRLEKQYPKLVTELELERADLAHRRKQKDEESRILTRLHADGAVPREERAEVLWRLGKMAMGDDETLDQAVQFFDELEKTFPESAHADEAQYFAGWIPYSQGKYEIAAERMLRFATTYRRSSMHAEALWYAGWSAYLARNDGLARRAFEQLLEEHPTSDLRPQARYWVGRIRQRAGETSGAQSDYRQVLAQAPLSYWGFWAMARLKDLGEEVVLNAPPPEQPVSIEQVVTLLGPKRPRGVDRAIALHAADLQDDALEELTGVNQYLRNVRDTAGRAMVADMLDALGAHYLAYRVATTITADGGELVSGKPWAWRAWRHAYPCAFGDAVSAASTAHALDRDLILSIMRTESSFRPAARSPVGAYGLMQLMPMTAAQIGRSTRDGRTHAARYKNPDSNIWLGGWYLARLVSRYGGQLAPAIGAYNAGPGAMDKWLGEHGGLELDEFVERIPYRETRRYVRRVLETYMIYRRLAGQPLVDLRGKVRPDLVSEGSVAF